MEFQLDLYMLQRDMIMLREAKVLLSDILKEYMLKTTIEEKGIQKDW